MGNRTVGPAVDKSQPKTPFTSGGTTGCHRVSHISLLTDLQGVKIQYISTAARFLNHQTEDPDNGIITTTCFMESLRPVF